MDEREQSPASALIEFVPRLARMIAVVLQNDEATTLTIRQYRILERLITRPHRTSELALSSNVTQPTVSTVVSALDGRGLVERLPDPDDGRATRIQITALGRTVFNNARARILDLLSEVTRDFGESATASLWEVVPSLLAGMDRVQYGVTHAAPDT